MKINKIETNIKRKLYMHETNNISLSPISSNLETQIIKIIPKYEFQTILGFGGAITESSGHALNTVNNNIFNETIDKYFSKKGINYNFCRIPIGSCDFSIDSYSYSYDKELSDFNIKRDLKYIIPVIKSAQNRNTKLQVIASPWSPPAFMKSNYRLSLGGKLLKEYKQTWANYLVKYINEYSKQNIQIEYMTIQNEPDAMQPWESCQYIAEEEADLLKNYLYPTFKKKGLSTKFLIWDHNKDKILERAESILIDNNSLNYATGIAFHWYTGSHFEALDLLSKLFPNKLLFHTEGCTGYSKFKPDDELFNAEMYASEIIGDFNNGVNAFIDWNIVLEYNGGPNHAENYCNSPIMINKKHDGYIITPSFYYIAHFSKYIEPNAKRIYFQKFSENISMTAFKNPDKSVIIILLNKTNSSIEYNLCYNNHVLHDNLDSHAIVTFVIKDV